MTINELIKELILLREKLGNVNVRQELIFLAQSSFEGHDFTGDILQVDDRDNCVYIQMDPSGDIISLICKELEADEEMKEEIEELRDQNKALRQELQRMRNKEHDDAN